MELSSKARSLYNQHDKDWFVERVVKLDTDRKALVRYIVAEKKYVGRITTWLHSDDEESEFPHRDTEEAVQTYKALSQEVKDMINE